MYLHTYVHIQTSKHKHTKYSRPELPLKSQTLGCTFADEMEGHWL